MKALFRILFALLIAFLSTRGKGQDLPEACVIVRVVDEFSRPFTNVEVGGAFEQPYKINVESAKLIHQRVRTDTNGIATLTGRTSGHVSYGADFPGYYNFHGRPVDFFKRDGNRWIPWGQTNTIVLKQIGNPVPMYARKLCEIYVPEAARPCGFDLMESDWVPPHGKGKHADLLFTVKGKVSGDRNYVGELKLTFPNEHDGIIRVSVDRMFGSLLKMPRFAPEDGYQPMRVWHVGEGELNAAKHKQASVATDSNTGYFLRIRTTLGETGKIKSALYGKILGDLEFDIRADKGAGYIRWSYYLNPESNSRNMEFDPAHNLFKKGGRTEIEVTEP